MYKTVLTALSLSLLGVVASAQTVTDLSAEAASEFGPAIGATAPELAVSDATGMARSLADLSGEAGVLVYFNRSLDWCPICLRQTLELESSLPAFEAAGWNVAVLTYDSVDTLSQVADRRGLSMDLLSDEGSVIIDAFGVRDPIYADPDHLAHGVPYPITFAIRSDGEVVAKFWHEAGLGEQRGYATRVTPDDVLSALVEG